MPDEATWEGFFCSERVLSELGVSPTVTDFADLGCGYGTFTLPAARIVSGTVYAIDVEPDMVARTGARAAAAGLTNIRGLVRDFMDVGTGLGDASVSYATLFNILHAEDPLRLLAEARRILTVDGTLGVMHWNYDANTPRGPSLDIRPNPQQCIAWAEAAGFRMMPPGVIALPPYHYGIRFRRAA